VLNLVTLEVIPLEKTDMTNLFVGNLGSNRTPDDLRRVFEAYGPVEGVEIMTDPETRYSRGFAFIEMTNDLEAKKAISHLNGAILWGKSIRVEGSRPRLSD
jgi:RNA recognition motif-containing protein